MPPTTDGARSGRFSRRLVALAGHTGDAEVVEAAMVDPDPGVRAAALGAAARLGLLDGLRLDRAVTDPSPVIRRRAAELSGVGGGAPGDAGAVTRLVALLNDEPTVVEAACFALGEIGAAAAGAVGSLAAVAGDHPDPICRETAVAALGAIGASEGLDAVLAATSDKPAIRRRAVLALAAFEGPEVDAALEAALSDRDWQVRQAAEDLLGRPGAP